MWTTETARATQTQDQLTSYDAQVRYYSDYIKEKDDWEFVEVYAVEGISGTHAKNRPGFQHMIDDAVTNRKIDLILTKSLSRFARNTVDSLTYIRKLKDAGVEVYFEKENIYTFDSKGEMLLTIMSSIAQEESRSISENILWGMHRRFEEGKYWVGYSAFLGYDKGENGKLVVNKEQAETVKFIFRRFLEGKTPYAISQELMELRMNTGRGNRNGAVRMSSGHSGMRSTVVTLSSRRPSRRIFLQSVRLTTGRPGSSSLRMAMRRSSHRNSSTWPSRSLRKGRRRSVSIHRSPSSPQGLSAAAVVDSMVPRYGFPQTSTVRSSGSATASSPRR